MEALGVRSPLEYLARLNGASGEWQALLPLIVTTEGYFQRDKGQLMQIRRHLRVRLDGGAPGERALLWVAGCAAGEDAYTLAAMLDEEGFSAGRVVVLATDLNPEALAKASTGVYSAWSFREAEAEFRERHFTPAESGWQVRPSLRQRVRFQAHNLVSDGLPCAPGGCCLVLCRNVMLYWRGSARRNVVGRFAQALEPGGWLIAGHNELAPEDAAGFEAQLSDGVLVFRRAAPEPRRHSERRAKNPPPPDHQPLAASSSARIPPPRLSVPEQATKQAAPRELDGIRRAADAGRIAEALAGCRLLLAREPGSVEALHLLATLQLGTPGTTAAESLLRQTLYLDAGFAPGYRDLALLLEARGDNTAAQRLRKELAAVLARGGRFKRDDPA